MAWSPFRGVMVVGRIYYRGLYFQILELPVLGASIPALQHLYERSVIYVNFLTCEITSSWCGPLSSYLIPIGLQLVVTRSCAQVLGTVFIFN